MILNGSYCFFSIRLFPLICVHSTIGILSGKYDSGQLWWILGQVKITCFRSFLSFHSQKADIFRSFRKANGKIGTIGTLLGSLGPYCDLRLDLKPMGLYGETMMAYEAYEAESWDLWDYEGLCGLWGGTLHWMIIFQITIWWQMLIICIICHNTRNMQ